MKYMIIYYSLYNGTKWCDNYVGLVFEINTAYQKMSELARDHSGDYALMVVEEGTDLTKISKPKGV